MAVFLVVWVLVAWAGWTMTASAQARPQSQAAGVVPAGSDDAALRAALDRYCVACHNQQLNTADLALDAATVDTAHVARDAETWEKVVRKLRTRTMPPLAMPRPNEATYVALTAGLETALDRAGAAQPTAGRAPIRRLNRTEYTAAIRDLLALEIDAASLLPGDDSAFGFDNISDVLGVSPALLERYLVAADIISALAVGAPVDAGSDTYRIRQDRSQDQHIEGLPLGTVGGLAVRHTFPVDGEYHFSLTLQSTNTASTRGLEHPHQIEITIDGERVFLHTVGGEAERAGGAGGRGTDRTDALHARLQVRVPVAAGPRLVGATFIRKIGAGSQRLQPFLRSSAGTYDSTGRPHIETLTIAGPFDPTGPGDTPSRRRIFTCRPAVAAEDEPCATSILTTLARRVLRRPATASEMDRLLDFYRAGRAQGGFESGVQMALRRLLASPSFVFRVEEAAPASAAAIPRVSDLELASRLSFFLWSSIPDDTLIDLAVEGRLSDPAVLDAQTRRMLADPRAAALATNFAGQWLHVRNLRNIVPNHDEFPDFDDTLRDAFERETALFFDSLLREDRSVLDLLTADHTFVNERLAKHYGIPYVYGSHFRRVTLPDDARRGILGKGALLTVTSHADRTAPTLRGKWILENVLGTPPPPPPADVPGLEEGDAAVPRSLRERLERHRANPACASCHALMDPLGFALEQFDAVGAYRTHEDGRAIDASGRLADGTDIDGVVALRRALLERSDVFVQTFTEKLLVYALGRGLQHDDMPVVRAIVREAAHDDHRFSAVILGIVHSVPFQMRTSTDPGASVTGASDAELVHAGN